VEPALSSPARVSAFSGVRATGAIYSGTGTVTNGVWRWTAERRAGGAVTAMRHTFRAATGGGRTMDVEVTAGSGTWAKIVSVTYKSAR
jgi:hypothetical protein